KVYYFGAFDGYGGAKSATFASKKAVSCVFWSFNALLEKQSALPFKKRLAVDRLIERAFKDSYIELATEIQRNFTDGTTAISALISGDTAYLACAGDARGLVFDTNGTIKAATKDHKPDAPEELARIGDISQVYYGHALKDN